MIILCYIILCFLLYFLISGMNGQGIGSSSFADYCRRVEGLPLTDDQKSVLEEWFVKYLAQ